MAPKAKETVGVDLTTLRDKFRSLTTSERMAMLNEIYRLVDQLEAHFREDDTRYHLIKHHKK